jgi:hypothetical protein
MSLGSARPCFIVGIKVIPPDMSLPFFAFLMSFTASATFVGR